MKCTDTKSRHLFKNSNSKTITLKTVGVKAEMVKITPLPFMIYFPSNWKRIYFANSSKIATQCSSTEKYKEDLSNCANDKQQFPYVQQLKLDNNYQQAN